jgi:hypothetical protein
MDTQERKDILQEAMEQLNAAIGNIETALRGTSHESHSQAYIVGHLRSWVDAEGTYNMGIQQYIDRLDEDGEELDEEIVEIVPEVALVPENLLESIPEPSRGVYLSGQQKPEYPEYKSAPTF